MNISKSALALLALGLSLSLRAEPSAADATPAYSRQGHNQLKRFENAVKSGAGQLHPDLPVISVQRYFNQKNWVQQIRWDAQTGFINEFAFPLPLKDARDFRALGGVEQTASGWIEVESEGARYEFSVRQIDKIYFRVQRRLLMPRFDIRLNSADARRLDFYRGDRRLYQFHLPLSLAGEIVGFKMRGQRLLVETSDRRRNYFALQSQGDEFSLEYIRYGQELVDLVDLRADAAIFGPDCQKQLKP